VTLEKVTTRNRGLDRPVLAFIHTASAGRRELIEFVDAAVRRVEFGVRLTAGDCYRVTVTALQLGSTQPHANYRSLGTGQTQFKAGLGFDKKTRHLGCMW